MLTRAADHHDLQDHSTQAGLDVVGTGFL